jgi:hypothetical protein
VSPRGSLKPHGYQPGQPLDAGHAYILTQQHGDNLSWWNGTWVPQTIPDRAHVQVQLPSNPIHWIPDLGPTCHPSRVADLAAAAACGTVDLLGTSTLPNAGRVAGTSEIAVFDYRVSGLGIAVLCLRPDPVPTDPGQIGSRRALHPTTWSP